MTTSVVRQVVKDHDWNYIVVGLSPDPNSHHHEELMKEFNRITIDLIVWKTIIQTALGRMYGLIGESLQFDLIMSHDHQVVLRVYKLDIDKFITSLMGYVINIGKYYDLENQRELHCGLQVIRYGDYLGLVVNHNID